MPGVGVHQPLWCFGRQIVQDADMFAGELQTFACGLDVHGGRPGLVELGLQVPKGLLRGRYLLFGVAVWVLVVGLLLCIDVRENLRAFGLFDLRVAEWLFGGLLSP